MNGMTIQAGMSTARSPTGLETTLSYIVSISPIFGIVLGVYYLTFPPGFRTLGSNCILISTVTTFVYVISLSLNYHVF